MNTIATLFQLGQSIWYDNIQRRLLQNGELAGMINRHEIFGVTSNPSIFQNAIAKSSDYDSSLKTMAWAGWNAEDIFWELAIEDIRTAADLFKPVYDETNRGDGYVSLEVNPLLANDTEGTLKQAIELWNRVNRENLMIKIPATQAGIKAIEMAIAEGLNINVTLIFSMDRYEQVIDAYLRGLEIRQAQGKSIEQIASVASFFVSRVDTKVDLLLQQIINGNPLDSAKASSLLGQIAISNAKVAYELFKQKFTDKRFELLAESGARLQRPLWASTSTKNPAYRDVVYLEELIGSDTVNTVPPSTLNAFIEHGKAGLTLGKGIELAQENLLTLNELGISIDKATSELETEGVYAFSEAFKSLILAIDIKRSSAIQELGSLAKPISVNVAKLVENSTVQRLFDVDPSLWTTESAGQEEIRKRCNWITAPWMNSESLIEYETFLDVCSAAGFTHALLLGMGGSSLAPEVMRLINGITERDNKKGLDLAILDSTDPLQVKAAFERSNPENTLYIVSSKSGGTAEVNAFFDYCWENTEKIIGKKTGDHFIAITDPGTALEKLAIERNFKKIFLADPMVGGRNSALTAFGLVPAALLGMDLHQLINNSLAIANQCVPEVPFGANPGAMLGVILGTAYNEGRDKLTVITDQNWNSFGSWLEQLVAESSGKQGKGIIPVAQEPIIEPEKYGADRLFVYLRSTGEQADFCTALRKMGQPVIEFIVNSAYDLGRQFYLWEVATAIATSIMQVNSFDQPDVQDNKSRTLAKIDGFRTDGFLKDREPVMTLFDSKIFGDIGIGNTSAKTIKELIFDYLIINVKKGDYVAINAYLPRNSTTGVKLTELRKQILEKFGVATTLGFGPRFLHSTGQLHKGGPNNGVFLQIIAEPSEDFEIPTEGITFATLERAQAIGDFEALESRGRRVIRIQLPKPDPSLLLV
ncbi:MAG: bifunctional transaldolase/phosoglucose isomerase [Anaerolineaceae bacterium]